jgi:hypothetical protein
MSHSRSALELAAERVLAACGPLVAKVRKSLDGRPAALMSEPVPVEEADEALGSLMALARALETR